MSDKRTCITCRHYAAKAPDDYAQLYGHEFCGALGQLRSYLLRINRVISKQGWPGKCRVDPVPVEVRSRGVCSRWEANCVLLQDFDDYQHAGERWNLIDRLRDELKAAKKQSVQRFRRIKALLALPEAERPRRDPGERLDKQIAAQRTTIGHQEKCIEDLRKALAEKAEETKRLRSGPPPAYVRQIELLEADLRYTRQELKAHRKQHEESIRALVSQYEGIIKELRGVPDELPCELPLPRDAMGTVYVMPAAKAD